MRLKRKNPCLTQGLDFTGFISGYCLLLLLGSNQGHSDSIQNAENYTAFKNFYKFLSSFIKILYSPTKNMAFIEDFNKNHPTFIKNLLIKSPSLTQREVLICMYLKFNYSNNDICELMKISRSTVDSYRHHARKKMKLKRSDSILSYLNSL